MLYPNLPAKLYEFVEELIFACGLPDADLSNVAGAVFLW
jgi:hypothetical protein